MEKKYWKSLEEIQPQSNGKYQEKQAPSEASSPMDILSDELNEKSSSRRDFLKWCGISFFSATVISACENPVKKAIPYLNQPEEIIPGKPTWYASSFIQGNEYCPILVKNRDGRPIKIEGNDLSSLTTGGTNARVQASVLSLYDDGARYKTPMENRNSTTWEKTDQKILSRLKDISANGGRMVLVTPTLVSPSTRSLIDEAVQHFPGLEVITWDAISYSAIRKAHQATFNRDIIPGFRFDKADLIISFSADFLGTWLSPVEFSAQYAKTRRLKKEKKDMSRHIQFESHFSITGANADHRHPVHPAKEAKILMALYDRIANATGNPVIGAPAVDFDVENLAKQILENRGKTLVVCGHNHSGMQMLVNGINYMTGNYENTLETSVPYNSGKGDNEAFENLVQDLENGEVDAILFYKTNPLYHYHQPEKLKAGIENTQLSISFSTAKDETAEACGFVLPDHHFLESWNDAEFKDGYFSLAQPVIRPLFKTRQFQDTLLTWMEKETDFHQYLKYQWEKAVYPTQTEHPDFYQFWVHALQKGIYEKPATETESLSYSPETLNEEITSVKTLANQEGEVVFNLYPGLAMYDGQDANNPWLQELPDPITSVAWDNFAALSPVTLKKMDLSEGDLIRVNQKIELPVLAQPGQANDCISLALGYGRTQAGKAGNNVGVNAFLLSKWEEGNRSFSGAVNSWEKSGSDHQFARTQTHFSMEGRAIVRESTLDKYQKDPAAGNELHQYHEDHKLTLYPGHNYEGHHWALMVDLNSCTGCSTCVIACQSENNTPVVGKDEVRRRRIMHWMRIDRYYNGTAENPQVVFQPLMCQHCDHAPCEAVCPVAATMHSSEGINQVTYNRCVGTKYCINNCPYKVRRFNWFQYAQNERFDYNMNSDFGRMVLNPDVTVRERGVVEKCSFCVQRIQDAKLKAKNERRKLRDGEVIPACVQACPSKALVFGDLNDKQSRVAKMIQDPRNYHLLEELHTLPTVGYLTKIRNPKA